MPRPASQLSADDRKPAPATAHRIRPTPTAPPIQEPVPAASHPQRPANQPGNALVPAMSNATRSTVEVRNTAVMPRSVAKAATPMTKKTTRDFKLPPPMRTSVLLPQPEASTMPKPNRPPPTRADNQITRLVV